MPEYALDPRVCDCGLLDLPGAVQKLFAEVDRVKPYMQGRRRTDVTVICPKCRTGHVLSWSVDRHGTERRR